MFREDSFENRGCDEWSGSRDPFDETSDEARAIDRALRRLALQQAERDVEELSWLRRAQELNIWPKLGYVHAFEYLEDVFAYSPHTAKERLRVARELGELPQIEQALASGELKFCVVRELTRVAIAANQAEWLERVRGQRLRAVEQMVAGRKKGDGPDAPQDPKRIKHRMSLELDGESMAAWRQLRAVLEDELGEKLDDRALVLELAVRIVAGNACGDESTHCADDEVAANEDGGENSPARDRSVKPRYTVHIAKCPGCRRASQNGAGISIEISANALARVECDAIVVDDENGERSAWTIPPATKRKVMARAQWRCQFPGCRAAHFLDVHHIIQRLLGGTNDDWNLIVLCAGHHRLLHDGVIEISGRAPDGLKFFRDGVALLAPGEVPAHVRLMADTRRVSNQNVEDAKLALKTLGFKAPEAKYAVDAACGVVGPNERLEDLIKVALRHCPAKKS